MSSSVTPPLEQRLQNLADQLRTAEPLATRRLEGLREAVVNPGPAGAAWAASDVHRLIAPGDVAERVYPPIPPDRRLRQLEALRNLVILLPLLVTWLGIWHAVESYRALLSDPANQSLVAQPFLLLWQRGFEGRITFGTLGHLAIVDVALLGLVVLLTWLTQRHFDRFALQTAARESNVETLRAELDDALAEARLKLATQYPTQPIQAVAQFDRSLQGLQTQLATQYQTVADLLTQRESDLQGLVAQHKAEHDALMAQRQAELTALAEQRRAEHDALTLQRQAEHDEVKAFVAEFRQGAGDLLSSASHLQPVVQQVAQGMEGLTQLAQALGAQLTDLLTAAGAAGTRLGQLTDGQADLARELRGAIGALDAGAGQLSHAVEALNTIAPTLIRAADQFAAASTQLTGEQRALVTTLDQERAALTQVALSATRATLGLDGTLTQMQKYSKDLFAATVDLNNLSRAVAQTLQAVNELSALAKANSLTASRLTATMDKVEFAATTVDTAVRSLAPASSGPDGAR